jgi:hypothetical protein
VGQGRGGAARDLAPTSEKIRLKRRGRPTAAPGGVLQ